MKPKATSLRPQELWTQENPTPSVAAYFDAHDGEFDTSEVESKYPYHGPASYWLRRLVKFKPDLGFHRFKGRGVGCWGAISDKILSGLTADLLAAADLLGGAQVAGSVSGPPGGFGMDQHEVWVPLLDGGVGVEVQIMQDEYTNKVQGRQATTIRGFRAYRVLLELLGTDCTNRRLVGEKNAPTRQELQRTVDELLKKTQA